MRAPVASNLYMRRFVLGWKKLGLDLASETSLPLTVSSARQSGSPGVRLARRGLWSPFFGISVRAGRVSSILAGRWVGFSTGEISIFGARFFGAALM
jgi:hypothetical protein